MGYHLEVNGLLVVPNDVLNLQTVQVGGRHQIIKEGERLYPVNIPFEFCDEDYKYYGKVVVRKLTLEANQTTLDIEIVKLFSPNEAAVFTANFIKI